MTTPSRLIRRTMTTTFDALGGTVEIRDVAEFHRGYWRDRQLDLCFQGQRIPLGTPDDAPRVLRELADLIEQEMA